MRLFGFNNKKDKQQQPPVNMFMNHLDNIFQQEPLFFKEESTIEGLPGVAAIVYKDVPEPGYITGITYGLSLVEHPDWKYGRPELCISVRSNDDAWARIVAFLANELRGDCPFSYGQVINFGEKISDDSDMNAFFVFAPSIMEKDDYLYIDVGAKYKISIAGIYPIYSEEIEIYNQMGLEAFWHHPDFELYDVNRKMITSIK